MTRNLMNRQKKKTEKKMFNWKGGPRENEFHSPFNKSCFNHPISYDFINVIIKIAAKPKTTSLMS